MARTHLALLRGVNVGGGNKLPMAELREMAARLGWDDVATHVNSGNLVFTADGTVPALEKALATAIQEFLGKPVQVLVVTADEWATAVAQCPYAPSEDKFVHLQVHRHAVPASVVAALQQATAEADDGTEVTVDGRWLYVHTPRGLSKSLAFTKFPRLVPKDDPGTARNLNSSKAIVRLLQAD